MDFDSCTNSHCRTKRIIPLKIQNTITVLIFLMIISGCASDRYGNLGIKNGRLSACPATPNCVSSQSIKKSNYIDPIHWPQNVPDIKNILFDTINAMRRTRIVSHDKNYVHVEFTTALFRFVDDVEFLIDEKNRIIHVRSASRVGYSDLGVNRKRVEKIRKTFSRFFTKATSK
jgi:uncharacterized protein (DUF1499 family)